MPQDAHIRIIEVEGQKFEVDLREAKVVDRFKVGDPVKLLKKYYDSWKVHSGAIVAIDAFENLPTIVIAYVPDVFNNDGKVEFAYLNAQSKDIEVAPMSGDEIMPTRQTIVKFFDVAIDTARKEATNLEEKKEWFLRQYGTAFGVGAEAVAAATASKD